MTNIADLALPTLPMESEDFSSNPWPYLAAAREQHPWLASCAFGYVVHQFDAMRELLVKDENLDGAYSDVVDILKAQDTQWGRFQQDSLLARTGEQHKRVRDLLAPAFTPQQANRHRPIMRETIAEVLDEWVPKGAFDFELFASHFPISVMCRLVGASPSVVPDIRQSLEDFGLSQSIDPKYLPALERATENLYAFVKGLVADRRRALAAGESHDDLLELLVKTVDSGGAMAEQELYDVLIFIFVAGYDTSKNALTLMMHVLVDRPDLYQRCAEDLAFCAKVVEENFRYLTTSTIPRVTIKDIDYRDVQIPKGTMLFFPVSVSGRDETAIDDPEAFDPERENRKRHMAFGLGKHMCLGQFIARAQIQEGLHQIAQRMQNPRRTGPSGWRPFYGVWGMKGLPIEFDPAPALEAVG
jgi:cytochrome P450